MVFSLDQSWYVLLFKALIALCASGFCFYLMFQSYQNLGKRWAAIRNTFFEKDVKKLLFHLLVVFLNVIYIWLLIQVEIVFIAGCFKVAPATLIEYNFSLWSFVALLMLLGITAMHRWTVAVKQKVE